MAKTLNERVAKYHGTPKGRLTHLMCNVRQRCKKWDTPCDIDGKYLLELYHLQNGRCAITGREFDLSTRNGQDVVNPYAMSIDRIEGSLGYIKGNVRLVAAIANVCKGRWTDEVLIQFCRDVMENNK